MAPHSEKDPAVVVIAGRQSLCSFLRKPDTVFTTHLACLFSYHSTSFYMLCMLEVTQKVTLLLRMYDADLVFLVFFFSFFYNSREKENLKIREEKEASPLED